MKLLTMFSTGLLGLACVLFWLGTWKAVGGPRKYTNPFVSRNGTWILDPTGFNDEELQQAGSLIGAEINSLRSVIEHNYESNGFMWKSALSAFSGGLLAVIRIMTMKRQAPQRATEPPPLPRDPRS